MPYARDSEVPDYVPAANRRKWRETWNHAYEGHKGDHDAAEAYAFGVANGLYGPNAKQEKAMKKPDFQKFIPFFKVDATTRQIYGLVTAELPDADGEVCDYESTLPYYKALIAEMGKVTDGANVCPLREMHQLSAVGKGVSFEPQDSTKEILMAFKVVDDDAWKKVEEKVYTGFSQGGDYVNKWAKDGYTYYTAKPAEVSLVDRPCLAAARFYIKADGSVQLQKAAGTTIEVSPGAQDRGDLYEAVKAMNKIAATVKPPNPHPSSFSTDAIAEVVRQTLLKAGLIKEAKTKRVAGEDLTSDCFAYVGDPDKTGTWKFPIKFSSDEKTKRHIRNALSRWSSAKGIPADEKAKVRAKIEAAAKKHGIEVTEESAKAVRAALIRVLTETMDLTAATKVVTAVEEIFAKVQPATKVLKGMYQVGDLAGLLQGLQWLVCSTEYERDYEQDDSTVPDELRDVLETLVPIFISLATEEASELIEHPAKAGKGGGMFKLFADLVAVFKKLAPEELKKADLPSTITADELEKTGKSIHETLDNMHKAHTDHHAAAVEMCKAHHDKMVKLHTDHMEAAHAHIEKIRKALGATDKEQPAGGDISEGAKAAAAAALKKQQDDAAAKAIADKAAADKAAADAAELLKKSGNEQLTALFNDLKKTLDEQKAANEATVADLKKANEKIEELGKQMPPHGPASTPFLVGRPGQSGGAPQAATGTTDRSGL